MDSLINDLNEHSFLIRLWTALPLLRRGKAMPTVQKIESPRRIFGLLEALWVTVEATVFGQILFVLSTLHAHLGLVLTPVCSLAYLALRPTFLFDKPAPAVFHGFGLHRMTMSRAAWLILGVQSLLLVVQSCLLPDLISCRERYAQASYAAILAVTIVTPVFEEIMFRGVVLVLLRRRGFSARAAVGVSAMLFGASHLLSNSSHGWLYALGQAVMTVASGLAFGSMVLSGSALSEVILLHILNNATALCVSTSVFLNNLAQYDTTTVASLFVRILVFLFVFWRAKI